MLLCCSDIRSAHTHARARALTRGSIEGRKEGRRKEKERIMVAINYVRTGDDLSGQGRRFCALRGTKGKGDMCM